MDKRRATEGPAGVLEQYVEESEGAQRRHGALCRRSMKLAEIFTKDLGEYFGCEKFGLKTDSD